MQRGTQRGTQRGVQFGLPGVMPGVRAAAVVPGRALVLPLLHHAIGSRTQYHPIVSQQQRIDAARMPHLLLHCLPVTDCPHSHDAAITACHHRLTIIHQYSAPHRNPATHTTQLTLPTHLIAVHSHWRPAEHSPWCRMRCRNHHTTSWSLPCRRTSHHCCCTARCSIQHSRRSSCLPFPALPCRPFLSSQDSITIYIQPTKLHCCCCCAR